MTPPATTTTCPASCLSSSFFNAGRSVLCPAAWDEIPMTWTSESIACKATSSGVWNSGPTSTSNPKSENPLAITLAPLSCPSCPIFATNIRGLLPSVSSNDSTSLRTDWYSSSISASLLLPPLLLLTLPPLLVNDAPYAPCTTDEVGICRPQAFSRACEISPRVHLTRAQSILNFIKFIGSSPADVHRSFNLALFSSFNNAVCTSSSFRSCFTFSILRICFSLTTLLSICNTSCISSLSSPLSVPSSKYLFTPTITSSLESIRPCFLVAHSSIRSFANPESI
mmetsp:Transcript_17993/g.24773  ORF Transcript_17993/g.24773 Transcript_17993/m.24773 type:complete len:282 (+) Transcript_17993:503-1348(+)